MKKTATPIAHDPLIVNDEGGLMEAIDQFQWFHDDELNNRAIEYARTMVQSIVGDRTWSAVQLIELLSAFFSKWKAVGPIDTDEAETCHIFLETIANCLTPNLSVVDIYNLLDQRLYIRQWCDAQSTLNGAHFVEALKSLPLDGELKFFGFGKFTRKRRRDGEHVSFTASTRYRDALAHGHEYNISGKLLAEMVDANPGPDSEVSKLNTERHGAFLNEIIGVVKNGQVVQIADMGAFCIFEFDSYASVNPRTKEEIVVPAKRLPTFVGFSRLDRG